MNNSIHHEFFYPYSSEIVWDYLTKPELIKLWLMETDFKPEQGAAFQFRTKPMPNFNFNGIVQCEVLEIIPFKKLSYSWKGGDNNGNVSLDSVVIWTLTEKDNGTKLVLDHTGFTGKETSMFAIMNQGWLKNIQLIDELIKKAYNAPTNA